MKDNTQYHILFEQWGNDRKLYENSNRHRQISKYLEEKGELAQAITKDSVVAIADAIGDMLVCLTHVAVFNYGLDILGAHLYNHARQSLTEEDRENWHITINTLLADLDHCTRRLVTPMSTFAFNAIIEALHKIADGYNLTLQRCMQHAWEQIKDRKGEFKDGLFIKD
jgi:NTP pyrophosphatase (non-canonical NTP hydrolase)